MLLALYTMVYNRRDQIDALRKSGTTASETRQRMANVQTCFWAILISTSLCNLHNIGDNVSFFETVAAWIPMTVLFPELTLFFALKEWFTAYNFANSA